MCTQPVLNYIFGTEHLCLRIPVIQYKQTIWRQHNHDKDSDLQSDIDL